MTSSSHGDQLNGGPSASSSAQGRHESRRDEEEPDDQGALIDDSREDGDQAQQVYSFQRLDSPYH